MNYAPTLTAFGCEYGYLNASCPLPFKISVISAFYGPNTLSTCWATCLNCSHCMQANVAWAFSGFNGQTKASLPITNGQMGGDSCFGYFKVAILTYQCINSTSTGLNKAFLYLSTNGVNTQTLNNTSPVIRDCRNIEKATINGTQYNLIVDGYNGVYLYDSNWVYRLSFLIPNVAYGILANNFYYFSTFTNGINIYGLIKTSLTSSTVIKSYGTVDTYRGLYYDSINSRIIACTTSDRVDTLNLDLNLLSSVTLQGFSPGGVTVYNSRIYVASYFNGYVAVISSNLIVTTTYQSRCSVYLGAISVDSFGYFALSCKGDGKVYIYDSNNNYTNKFISFDYVLDARLDINTNLAVCGGRNVKIYS
jgi:hypothetical protein